MRGGVVVEKGILFRVDLQLPGFFRQFPTEIFHPGQVVEVADAGLFMPAAKSNELIEGRFGAGCWSFRPGKRELCSGIGAELWMAQSTLEKSHAFFCFIIAMGGFCSRVQKASAVTKQPVGNST